MEFQEVNQFQTTLTEELMNNYPKEVIDDLLDYVANVPFIQNLISPNRERAKDRPRDKNGKIIIDLANPHILEDMDYFRETAIHYQKYGCFSKLRVNSSPQSEYMRWFKREVDRCWNGMVRPEDGEWITGDMYFYLNYFPIIQTEILKDDMGNQLGIGDRTIDFPKMWEGVYWRSHYMHQARYGGLYNNFTGGQHGVEIAARGKSKSYFMGAKLAKNFILGTGIDKKTGKPKKKVKSLVSAYQKEYLNKDGILNKFVDAINFLCEHNDVTRSLNTQFPSKKIKKSWADLQWVAGWLDKDANSKGSNNEVLGVAVADDVDKMRGKRPLAYSCNVLTPNGFKKWSDIKLGDIIYGDDGLETRVLNIEEAGEQNIYKITLKDGRVTYCTEDHPWSIIYRSGGKLKENTRLTKDLINNTVYINNKGNRIYKFAIRNNKCVQFKENNVLIDPYVMGLYLGDGCYNKSESNRLNITMSLEDINDIEKHIPYNVLKSRGREITHFIEIGEHKNSHIKKLLNYYSLDYCDSSNKFIPNDYLFNSEENRIKLLNGLLDSDGSCTKDFGVIEYSTNSEKLKDNFLFLCRSLGFNCKSIKRNNNYRCYIYTNDSRLFNLERKKKNLKIKNKSYSDRTAIVSVEFSHIEKAKCVTVDNNTHLHLIDDFIITHNSDFMGYEEFGMYPKFLEVWQTSLPNVQEGSVAFGQAYAIGTGGSEGSDFYGAYEMIINPKGYNVYSLPNVYDKGSSGDKMTIFFFPDYVNRAGCYNEDGVSDVIKAILEECMERYILKYNSSDPNQLTRKRAERPFTLQDAIMRRESTIYPVSSLNDRVSEIENNPSIENRLLVGRLNIIDGKVEFKPDGDLKHIRTFPHKDNSLEGAVAINKLPITDSSGKVPWGRYIAGCDPYDDDHSQTLSLFSGFILDLWTDEIVLEYTGRPRFADEAYEVWRKCLLFYNAECNYENNKKGLYTYFSRYNCLYLLSDTLEFLKDKEMIKGGLYGNKSKGTPNYSNTKSGGIAGYARRCNREYLLKPVDIVKEIDGEEIVVNVPLLNICPYRAMLKEFAMWNGDLNTDRHDAICMLMLLREDKLRLIGDNSFEDRYNENDLAYLGNDKFFNKNYKNEPFELHPLLKKIFEGENQQKNKNS